MELQGLAKDLFKAVEAVKRISRVQFTEEELESVLLTLDAINALPRSEDVVNGHLVSSYEIPKGWDSLVLPRWFSFGGTVRNPDLLNRPTMPKKEGIISPSEFNTIVIKIMGTVRNHDSIKRVERPEVEQFKSEREYLVDGKFLYEDAQLGMFDLDGSKVQSVLNVTMHTEDVRKEFVLSLARALSSNVSQSSNA